jgi:hypothetical protein
MSNPIAISGRDLESSIAGLPVLTTGEFLR